MLNWAVERADHKGSVLASTLHQHLYRIVQEAVRYHVTGADADNLIGLWSALFQSA